MADVLVVVHDQDALACAHACFIPSRRRIPPSGSDHWKVARILICEPHRDIEALLRVVIERLGHEAVHYEGGPVDDVDAAVIEPGQGDGLRLARSSRISDA